MHKWNQRKKGYFFSFICTLFATYEKTLRYEKVYDAIVNGEGQKAASATTAIENAYQKN